jgi:hypothetical protein
MIEVTIPDWSPIDEFDWDQFFSDPEVDIMPLPDIPHDGGVYSPDLSQVDLTDLQDGAVDLLPFLDGFDPFIFQ